MNRILFEKKLEKATYANGILEFKLDLWSEFMDLHSYFMINAKDHIWRGHRCSDWSLASTLDRLFDRLMKETYGLSGIKIDDSFLQLHLDQFKYAVRGRRGSNPTKIKEDDDWWALGQHQGLATPLLDWTTSPYVAAYFAFAEIGEHQTLDRIIYALNENVIVKTVKELQKKETESLKKEAEGEPEEYQSRLSGKVIALEPGRLRKAFAAMMLEKGVKPEIKIIRPFSDENPRLLSQGGLFTKAPLGETIESWVEKNFTGIQLPVLFKFLILNKERETCLKSLNCMNINHLSLFPDLYGASKYCNLRAEIKDY